MGTFVLRRYRCLRPLHIYGRILSTGEQIRLPAADAEQYIESGHLIAVEAVNGSDRQWTVPEVR